MDSDSTALLVLVLERRFGVLTPRQRAMVAGADLATKAVWLEALPTARCLDDLFAARGFQTGELASSPAALSDLIDASPVPMVITEGVGDFERIVFLNREFRQRIGYTESDIPDVRYWWPLAYPDPAYREPIAQAWKERMARAARDRDRIDPMEVRIRCGDGAVRVFQAHATSIGSWNLGVFVEITALREAQEELALSKEWLEEAQRIARLGHWIARPEGGDPGRGTLWWSRVTYEIFGRDPSLGAPTIEQYRALVHSRDRDRIKRLVAECADDGHYEIEYRVVREGGEPVWVRELGRVLRDDTGRVERVIGTVLDVTRQRALQQELEYRASHDALTGLYNRAKLQQLLRGLELGYRESREPFSVVLLDVDHFKTVNDRFGHAMGDEVLQELSWRMAGVLEAEQHAGRWGGEEFMVLLPRVDEHGASIVAERIAEAVTRHEVACAGRVTVSIGVAEMRPGLSGGALENLADRALYAAKGDGRDCIRRASELPPG
ncbi:sensor domain-containing diguanylate cyclase [Aquisalimonas asiatica]|uniref:diguanylate cyclase n=1 Tax=Aquisalimonas asiatica TaxID=406100 RepID=A0A1H8V8K9_9GAMM|nr:sensor domain-containing diguanylate cyclase [Aquisalimonas asiatica]SEP11719.1 PAS domain S-box-containing protein/diguanylate cyclase (GGDEF) domain-containing protein [Aquisalimonas asiatica]